MPSAWRPLRLVVDSGSVSGSDLDLLRLLGNEEELDLWETDARADQRIEIGDPFDAPPAMGGARSVGALSDHRSHHFGVYGVTRLQVEAGELAQAGVGAADDLADVLFFAAASEQFKSDGFVTNHDWLIARRGPNRPIAFRPAEACGLVGLAMRAHGNPSIGQDMPRMRMTPATFHFLLGRELLRKGWPWFGGVVAHDQAHRDESIVYLAQTAMERFQRVLQIRDRLHFATKDKPSQAREDDITFELETLLLFLSASFDAAARVAHVVYLNGRYESAGWRRQAWLERLAKPAPELAAAVADGTPAALLLQIIGKLRNTIHGESLRAGGVQRGGRTTGFTRVAGREADALRRLVAQRGDSLESWGVAEETQSLALLPDRFVEHLLPEATSLLNELMRLTDTSLLPGAAGSLLIADVEDRPEAGKLDDLFAADVRRRVRLLGGFA